MNEEMKRYRKKLRKAYNLLVEDFEIRKKIQREEILEQERLLKLRILSELNNTLKQDKQREKEGLSYIG